MAVGPLGYVLGLPPRGEAAGQPDPDAVLGEFEADLRAGRPVTLVDAVGKVRWQKSKPLPVNGASVEGSFAFQTSPTTFVTLLPSVPVDHYRVEADVCQGNPAGRSVAAIGIYVGGRPTTHPDGVVGFRDWSLTFDEIEESKTPKGSMRVVRFSDSQLFFPGGWLGPVGGGDFIDIFAATFEPRIERPVWRKLILDVSPNVVSARFGSTGADLQRIGPKGGFDPNFGHPIHVKQFRAIDLGRYAKFAAELAPFDPRGELGLTASATEAMYRNVRIVPAAEP